MIDGFYIIKNGLIVYSISTDKGKIDANLIGGFLTALNTFANAIQHGDNLKQMVIGNTTFSFKIVKSVIFVFRQSKFNPAVLQNLSEELIDAFLEKYELVIDDWDGGDKSIFKDFNKEVNNILDLYIPLEYKDDSIDYVSSDIESRIIDKMKQEGVLPEKYEKLCKICKMEIIEGLEKSIECSNKHPVHEECLREWLNYSQKCPSCRVNYSKEIIASIKNT